MTIYFSQDLEFQTTEPLYQKLKRTHIGYESIVTTSNITASSQAAGFPVTNIVNPLTAERWKPTALPATLTVNYGAPVDVNYIGMASHTFGRDSVSVIVEHSADGVSWTQIDESLPATNRAVMRIFEITTAQYWRITLNNASGNIPSVGALYIGQTLEMERGMYDGHTPITMARKTKRIKNKTEGGQYAGVSIINEGVEGSFSWSNLTSAWYRSTFDPFVVAARARPFFIAHRYQDYPTEVGYVWTTGDIQPTQQTGGVNGFMSVSMQVAGYSDE